MVSLAVEVRLPSLDEWQVIMRDKALTLPDVMTVQYGRVLIARQSASRLSIGVRIIASNQRTRQNDDKEKRKQLFHNPPMGQEVRMRRQY